MYLQSGCFNRKIQVPKLVKMCPFIVKQMGNLNAINNLPMRTFQYILLRYPKPTVTWKKAIGSSPGEYKDFLYEPNVSLDVNGSIHFTKITKESQGYFLCEAKNNIGTGVSKVIFLKVNGELNYAYFKNVSNEVCHSSTCSFFYKK